MWASEPGPKKDQFTLLIVPEFERFLCTASLRYLFGYWKLFFVNSCYVALLKNSISQGKSNPTMLENDVKRLIKTESYSEVIDSLLWFHC